MFTRNIQHASSGSKTPRPPGHLLSACPITAALASLLVRIYQQVQNVIALRMCPLYAHSEIVVTDRREGVIVSLIAVMVLLMAGLAIGFLIGGERRGFERERLARWSWNLWYWEQELLNTAEVQGCPSCELLRRRHELQRRPLG